MLKNDCKNIIINIGGKMKKTVLLIAIPIVVILFSVCGLLITKNTTNRLIKDQNTARGNYGTGPCREETCDRTDPPGGTWHGGRDAFAHPCGKSGTYWPVPRSADAEAG